MITIVPIRLNVRRGIIYLQTASSVHSVRKIHIALGETFNPTNTDSGITQCPDGLYSPPGSDSADDCGRILHIGEYVLYLRTAKLTSPALHVKIGDVIYYGDMFPA